MHRIIAVKVDARGKVEDGRKTIETNTVARCDLCDRIVDAVASVAAETYACKVCLRVRLEAITVALYELREPGNSGLPWGKVSG
jgi:hypothetical protein